MPTICIAHKGYWIFRTLSFASILSDNFLDFKPASPYDIIHLTLLAIKQIMLKILFYFVFILCISISCDSSQDTYPLENTSGKSIYPELFDKDESQINSSKKDLVINSVKKEVVEDQLKTALNDPNISSYLKKVYNQKQLVPANDSLMLTITDSLSSKSKNLLFYFLTFTYSMNGSNGFYSEALSMESLEYVKTQTEQFCTNFKTTPLLTEKHFENWASYILGEISISNENNEEEAISKLEKQLTANLVEKRKDYQQIIKKLIAKIKQPIKHR